MHHLRHLVPTPYIFALSACCAVHSLWLPLKGISYCWWVQRNFSLTLYITQGSTDTISVHKPILIVLSTFLSFFPSLFLSFFLSLFLSFSLSFFLSSFIYFVITFKSELNLHLVMSQCWDDNPTAEGFLLLLDSLFLICQLSKTKRYII